MSGVRFTLFLLNSAVYCKYEKETDYLNIK